MKTNKEIEETILNITINLINKWQKRFDLIHLDFDEPYINRYGDNQNYFSEIECNIWNRNGNLISAFSIIIFMENKQLLSIEEAENFIDKEIEICYHEKDI